MMSELVLRVLRNRASWYGCSGYWVPPSVDDRVLRLGLVGTPGGPMNATTDRANNLMLLSGLFSRRASRSSGVKIQSTCYATWAGQRSSLRQHVETRFGLPEQGVGTCGVRPLRLGSLVETTVMSSRTRIGFPWESTRQYGHFMPGVVQQFAGVVFHGPRCIRCSRAVAGGVGRLRLSCSSMRA